MGSAPIQRAYLSARSRCGVPGLTERRKDNTTEPDDEGLCGGEAALQLGLLRNHRQANAERVTHRAMKDALVVLQSAAWAVLSHCCSHSAPQLLLWRVNANNDLATRGATSRPSLLHAFYCDCPMSTPMQMQSLANQIGLPAGRRGVGNSTRPKASGQRRSRACVRFPPVQLLNGVPTDWLTKE